jgi:hypothetical protein
MTGSVQLINRKVLSQDAARHSALDWSIVVVVKDSVDDPANSDRIKGE